MLAETKSFIPPDIKDAVKHLSTVRDFIRYGVSMFNKANLFFGHGTFTAFDEAVFLVLEGLHLPIDELEPYLDAMLLPKEKKRIAQLLHDRVVTRKPAAYLVNKAYLHGRAFYVDERVIVPRSYISDLLFNDIIDNAGYPLINDVDDIGRVLDLCTGSGCLALLAAEIFGMAEIDAVDLSPDALEVAKINVEKSYFKDRVHLYRGDLFEPLVGKKYDFIITNPPYVDMNDMQNMPEEYLREPQMALAGGVDGLDLVHTILKEAPQYMNEGACMVVEIGYGREELEEARPDIDFLWLDTENSYGEVFWVTKEQLVA